MNFWSRLSDKYYIGDGKKKDIACERKSGREEKENILLCWNSIGQSDGYIHIYNITFYEKNLHTAGLSLDSMQPQVRETEDMLESAVTASYPSGNWFVNEMSGNFVCSFLAWVATKWVQIKTTGVKCSTLSKKFLICLCQLIVISTERRILISKCSYILRLKI